MNAPQQITGYSDALNHEADRSRTATTAYRGGRPRVWRRRLLFPLIAIGLGLLSAVVIGEIVLRLFVDQEAKRLATYDETLGWRGRPNGSGIYSRKADNIRVPFHYNNLGFRDEDVTAKLEHSQRLMMLGDSFIENLEVEYEETFPALLEQHVKARDDDWDVAVVGSQGYSTSQELLAFRKYHELISPDIVLLCFFCGNDFEDNLRRQFAYLDNDGQLQVPPNQSPQWKHLAKKFQRWLYESSHVVFLLKNSLQSVLNVNIAPESKTAVEAGQEYKQAITTKLISKLDQEVRATGAEFGVIVIPDRDDLVAADNTRQRNVTQFCLENNIAHLDLSPLLGVEDFFETDFHFNVQGHQIVAKAIDAFVAESFRGRD